jgi:heat shock protein HslJ
MKRFRVIFGLLFVLCLALALTLNVSCAGVAEAAVGEPVTFSGGTTPSGNSETGQRSSEVIVSTLNDVEGKEWILTELRSAGTTTPIDRSKLGSADTNGSFTISFQDGTVRGVGWPNRYFGPYTVGSGETLGIGDLASTMMAAFIELDELKEHDFYAYLSKVTRRAVLDGKLELYSTSDGRETTLVFELR